MRNCCGQFLAANCIPLLVQQRLNRYYSFNRSWEEFKVGFNDSRGNYWLGNDLLHQVTREARYKLRCLIQGTTARTSVLVAYYDTFLVGSESSNYTLRVAHYSGNAGDNLNNHNGMMFTTYDRDNDLNAENNCAQLNGGGFWYKNCYTGYGGGMAGVTVNRGQGTGFGWGTTALQRVTMLLTC